jgi:hypothetical protein
MPISNATLLKVIPQWIIQYAENNYKNYLIIPFTGTINDIALTKVALEAKTICGLLNVFCLVNSQFQNIYQEWFGNSNIKYKLFDNSDLSIFYLNAHYLANENNGIVLGSIDKTRSQVRSYNKLSEYTADIFPFYDIKFSQILEIIKNFPEHKQELINIRKESFQDEYELLEWCLESDKLYGIITSDVMPNLHPRWPFFTNTQKTAIARFNRIEKTTRHKQINKPYYKIND